MFPTKRMQSLLAVGLALLILSGSVLADDRDDRIGHGRLLRKLRDNLLGKKEPTPAGHPTARKAEKQPTPARPERQTTPVPRPSHSLFPAAQRGPTRLSIPNSTSRTGVPTPVTSTPVTPRRSAKAQGFGMMVQEDKNDQLVVTRVEPDGNAAKAGVARGDLVLQVGGAEIGSAKEIDEIAKLLKPGDQIEFQISHRGKKRKVLVQLGTPQEGDAKMAITPSEPAPARPGSKSQSKYDFVPSQQESSAYRSVVERPLSERSAAPAGAERIIKQQREQIIALQREIARLKHQINNPSSARRIQPRGPILRGPSR